MIDKIEGRSATVGVVGLGYAGLPVALAFAEAGFNVSAVDTDETRIAALQRGCSYVRDVEDVRVAEAVEAGRLSPSTTLDPLSACRAILICVPTPLKDGAPDLSLVVSASASLAGGAGASSTPGGAAASRAAGARTWVTSRRASSKARSTSARSACRSSAGCAETAWPRGQKMPLSGRRPPHAGHDRSLIDSNTSRKGYR